MTLAEPEAVAEFASVTVNDSVFVPLVGSVLLRVPVPVYGEVPPEADTVQLNGLPAVTPLVGHETVTTSGVPTMFTVAEPEALTALVSVTVNDSTLLPFVVSVRLNVPVPVYGVVPPAALTVQLNAVFTLAEDGHDTVTTRG